MTLPAFGPAFDADECMEILRLAAAVSGFLPFTKRAKDGAAQLIPGNPANGAPVVNTVDDALDNSEHGHPLPNLFYERWPSG